MCVAHTSEQTRQWFFLAVGAVRKPGQPVYDLTYPPLFKLLSSSNLKHQETCAFVNFPADVN